MTTAVRPRRRLRGRAPPPQRLLGRLERLYLERQERDLRLAYPRGLPKHPRQSQHPQGFWFDPVAADFPVQFIQSYCRHSKGEWAGELIQLQPDWQLPIVRTIFGWRRQDGTRRFRIAYIEIPRKNTKSTTAAALGLYLMVGDNEPGAEIYSSATKEKQATIVWGAARDMVKLDPELKAYIKPLQKNLSCEIMGSKFEPLGADSDRLDGLNPSGNIIDELHAHKNRGLWDVLLTAMGARRQPLTIAITTAGVYDPTSIGWEQHQHAVQVLEGAIEDEEFFAYIAAADEGDDWRDPAIWHKANPSLGVSIKPTYLAAQARIAQQQPSFLNSFLRLHLNVWTQQLTRWITTEDWNACKAAPRPLEGRVAYGGIDLSTKIDVAGFSLVVPDEDGFYDLYFRFWVPEALVQERERLHQLPSYSAWVRDGFLSATPGNVVDYDIIRGEILDLAKRVKLKAIGYDPWNATQLAVQLQQALNPTVLKTGFQMVELRQGMQTLSEPSKEFEKLVKAGKVRHGGHPVMRWMVANVTTRTDANGNIAPDKEHSGGKIDGVVSTILALRQAITAPVKTSVYETRGAVEVDL